ncbi:MAG: hypothetical protein ACI88H_001600 [Cocleimonas sp.]|jgi:hypothetical protein
MTTDKGRKNEDNRYFCSEYEDFKLKLNLTLISKVP